MPVFNNILAGAAGSGGDAGYTIQRSLRFNSGSSSHLSRTPSSAGNRKTWTWAAWVKISKTDSTARLFQARDGSSGNQTFIQLRNDNKIYVAGNSGAFIVNTDAVFRDSGAWGHLCVSFDTTQSNAADRIRIFWNGVQQDVSGTQPSQDYSTAQINSTLIHSIGNDSGTNGEFFNGYLADVHLLDGIAVSDPDGVFGKFDADTGVWNPIKYTGSYTTSGVSFDFAEQQLYAGGTREALFDGSTSTGCNFQKTTASNSADAPSNTKRIKVTFPTAKTGVTKLRIYGGGNTSSTNKVWYNDDVSTMITNDDPVGWKTVYTGSAITINSISFGTSNGGCNLRAIEINDVVLTDAIEHGLNSFHLDFSDDSSVAALGYDAAGNNNWTVNNIGVTNVDYTNSLTSQSLDTSVRSGSVSNIFNGDIVDKYEWNVSGTSYGNSGTFTITFNPALNVTSGLRVHAWLNDNQYDKHGISVNGGSYYYPNIYGGNNQWHDLLDSSYSNNTGFTGGTLNTLSFKAVVDMNGQNPSGYVRAIEVNGVQLTDSSVDVFRDSPTNYDDGTNVGGNFAVMNPLTKRADVILSNGNLDCSVTSGSNSWSGRKVFSTIGVNSGKWYAEMTVNSAGSVYAAICGNTENINESISIGWQSQGWGYYRDGIIVIQQTEISSGIPSYGTGDIIGVALDVDNLKVKWYKNGTQIGASAGYDITPNLTWFFAFDSYTTSNVSWNFGQKPFAISSVPTGFKSLCTQNFDDPTIADSSDYFEAKLYTGNGSTNTVSGLSFSPDWTWIKKRNSNSSHSIHDTVRGATKRIRSESSDAETTETTALTAFTSDGFTLGSGGTANGNNDSFVSWNWNAASSNTTISAGGLNSSVYDDSQNWSGLLSASGGSGFTNQGNGAFAGYDTNQDYTYVTGASSGTNYTITFTPTSTVNFTSAVVVRTEANYGEASIDGGSTWVSGGSSGVCTFAGPGSFSSIIVRDSRGQYSGEFHSIKIDGKLLVNSGVTPPNVPTIPSTVRANPTAGFSIVEYTGNASNSTVGHGLLNAAPEFIIVKCREAASGWAVYHDAIGTSTNNYIELQSTAAAGQDNTAFQNTAPTSSVFSIGTKASVNNSGDSHIAYCFAPVAGYSAFSSFEATGAADNFVYTGFRSRLVWIKEADNSNPWFIYDTVRNTYNTIDNILWANSSNSESTIGAGNGSNQNGLQIFSNGFAIPHTLSGTNRSASTYIFCAWAENPFKYARAR